jgi:hypothetical protein
MEGRGFHGSFMGVRVLELDYKRHLGFIFCFFSNAKPWHLFWHICFCQPSSFYLWFVTFIPSYFCFLKLSFYYIFFGYSSWFSFKGFFSRVCCSIYDIWRLGSQVLTWVPQVTMKSCLTRFKRRAKLQYKLLLLASTLGDFFT